MDLIILPNYTRGKRLHISDIWTGCNSETMVTHNLNLKMVTFNRTSENSTFGEISGRDPSPKPSRISLLFRTPPSLSSLLPLPFPFRTPWCDVCPNSQWLLVDFLAPGPISDRSRGGGLWKRRGENTFETWISQVRGLLTFFNWLWVHGLIKCQILKFLDPQSQFANGWGRERRNIVNKVQIDHGRYFMQIVSDGQKIQWVGLSIHFSNK